jgi:hypothetical protein
MVETHKKGANSGEVKVLRVEGGVGCLSCHGHGLGCPIQEEDGNVITGGVGSMDALDRERLDSQHGGSRNHRDWNQR